jgi:hypothetical protein
MRSIQIAPGIFSGTSRAQWHNHFNFAFCDGGSRSGDKAGKHGGR